MNQVKQKWFLGLVSVLLGAATVLLPLQALAQSPARLVQESVTPITHFDSVYRLLMSETKNAGEFQVELHLEPGATSEPSSSQNQIRITGSQRRFVLIVGRWKDLPTAVQALTGRSYDTLIAVVTDAKEHLVNGKLSWPEGTPDSVTGREGLSVYAPTDLGGPERVASSAITLFLAAAKNPHCEAKIANVWSAPAGAWGVPKDQKPVGFSATAELLLRSAKANARTMIDSALVIHLPWRIGASENGFQAYSKFSSTGSWLDLSMAERVVLGLGVELLPRARGLEVKVAFSGDWQLINWQEFRLMYLRQKGVPSYFAESVLQGNQPGSLNEAATLAVQDWAQTIERDSLQSERRYQERVEAITRDAARRLERAKAFGRFVEILAVEVQERTLPTAGLSFGSGTGSKNTVIPVDWVPVGSVLPSTKNVTLGEYRALLNRAIETSARINALEIKTPQPYRLPNHRRAR